VIRRDALSMMPCLGGLEVALDLETYIKMVNIARNNYEMMKIINNI
jgi:hypothetical protein